MPKLGLQRGLIRRGASMSQRAAALGARLRVRLPAWLKLELSAGATLELFHGTPRSQMEDSLAN
jgi:hypothetical protein